jgi:hypothetical protein
MIATIDNTSGTNMIITQRADMDISVYDYTNYSSNSNDSWSGGIIFKFNKNLIFVGYSIEGSIYTGFQWAIIIPNKISTTKSPLLKRTRKRMKIFKQQLSFSFQFILMVVLVNL